MNLNNLLKLSHEAFLKKNFSDAKKYLEDAIKIDPDSYEVNYRLAIILNNLGGLTESINYFNKAALANPYSISVYLNLGNVYLKTNNFDLSLENYLKAKKIDPKNFKVNYNLGNYYFFKDDIENAEMYFHKSIEIDPNNIYPYNNLFLLYDRTNNLKKIEDLIKKAKKIFGNNSTIQFFEGTYNFRIKKYKKVIEIFENIQINENDIQRKVLIKNMLARSFDSLGLFNKSYDLYEISNKILFNAYKNKINKNNYIKIVNDRLSFFSKNNFSLKKNKKFENNISDPVFLIGFPRSGTTLLDTILRTHNLINVIEEKPLVDQLITELQKIIKNDFTKLNQIDDNLIYDLRNKYFQKREKFYKYEKGKIYIDKLPLNIVHIAEICQIFPNAKFILTLRHPFDAVLSCFMQPFIPNDAMSNFFNLYDASVLYDLVMKLWIKYNDLIEFKLHIIKYEDLINNFENSTKGLLKFLEVNWNEKIKKYHKTAENQRVINTPSYDQVNLPLYSHSIGRWNNYSDRFSNVNKILNPWVKKFKY